MISSAKINCNIAVKVEGGQKLGVRALNIMCFHDFSQKGTAQISCWMGFVCSILQTAVVLQVKTTNNLVCLPVGAWYLTPLATFKPYPYGMLNV